MTLKNLFFIVKADGNRVPYDERKLRKSLSHAGATDETVNRIVAHIEAELYDGMTTHDLYKHAFSILRLEAPPFAAHYSMKRAVLALGPSGFPFEQFVAEIFKRKGFAVLTQQQVQGVCTRHEVDVTAHKGEMCIGMELKFHNNLGTKSDIKDALYVHARFDDIIKWQDIHPRGNGPCIDEGWFVTNTKFTRHAEKYGTCAGLTLISWSYPKEGSLEDLIRETGAQPITCLTSLSGVEKRKLMDRDVVLCQSVHQNPDVLREVGIKAKNADAAVAESKAVCRV